MPSKRKAENFDPNKSDSNDTDFDPSETRAPPKKSRRSAGHKKSSSRPAKRRRYKGSDVSEDDLDDDDDLSVSEQSEEDEDFEMNEKTGRRMRKAATKSVNYEEPSESDQDDLDASDSEEVKVTKNKSPKKRSKPVYDDDDDDEEEEEEKPTPNTPSRSHPKRKVVTLKIGTPAARSTRAGSALQSAAGTRPRRGSTAEPKSAGIAGRRATRATSEALGEEPIALSESGRHVIREGKSPEPLGRRADRGGKGIKQPASTIKEELHESTTQEDHEEDIVMATEVPGTDEREELDDADVGDGDEDEQGQANEVEEGAAQPAVADDDDDDDDDDEDVPITRRRESRPGLVVSDIPAEEEGDATAQQSAGGSRRLRNRSMKNKHQRKPTDASSDFEPVEDSPDELSASDNGAKNDKEDDYESGSQRRGRRGNQAKSKSTSRRRSPDSNPEELDEDELAEELYDLKAGSRKRRPRVLEPGIVYEKSTTRTRKPVDYSIKPMDQIYAMDEDAEDAAPTPTRRGGGGGRTRATQPYERSLYSTFGPFGGGIGPAAVIGGPWGTGAAGGVDSDSSDDENMARPTGVGGSIGMTPTSAMPPGLLPNLGQTNLDPTGALSGTPSALGKVGSRKALADADPLGVDQDVDFSKIGGLDGHIDQLKEMVQMPLLYPELFLKFHVTPPRGVLFHGPPGTGKTLLARALSSTISSGGRKITFYMRKGADALSKWVGEAERQLRLLFEEARKNQPSIIFFDEIDGLAPVRSSKQEQIHASIVSTLLALMDGMDGRGQVIVIGATNRPDNIDPALRRPGRFDREFYFPLPDQAARRSIININTPGWPIDDSFRDKLAEETKGYGGADLRALCTEAAINAMQRTFPQVYHSNDKLIIDTDKVKIIAKDFMLSLKKMIPSSERSTSSGAMPLPKVVEPLLRDELKRIENILDDLIPIKKKTTALQEAMFEQYDDADQGFARETMQQEFERSRVFRPRMLIHGQPGMGQNYIAGAVLNHFEGLHVQSFDLPTIFNDSGRNAEHAIVQLFAEVKRHKPSVIYLPGVDIWWRTLTDTQIELFTSMLRSIPPTDPVLVLAITDDTLEKIDPSILVNLFGYSTKNRVEIKRPTKEQREAFFSNVLDYVRKTPKEFPEPQNRKKRKLEVLQIAPPPEVKPPTKAEIKAQEKKDHQILNILKISIQPVMDHIQKKYRKFRTPAIPLAQIQYLIDEADPNHVRSDTVGFRPYEIDTDKDGVQGLRETASGKFFYNLETTTIEERLSNGFYARPRDFLHDIKTLAKDAKNGGDKDRLLRANELVANVEVDIAGIENNPILADCENIYKRQLQRTKEREEKERKRTEENPFGGIVRTDLPEVEPSDPHQLSLVLGEPVPKRQATGAFFSTPVHGSGSMSNGVSSDTNGSSVPSRKSDDIVMAGTDEYSQPTQASHPMHPPSQLGRIMGANFSNPAPTSQISQRSAFQEIPHGTSPSDLINDASTTTSGKKTSTDGWSTQATNGIPHGAQSSSPIDKPGHDSQLPDTQQGASQRPSQQENSSSGSDEPWLHSQAHGLARGNLQGLSQNTPSTGSQHSSNPAVPPFNVPSRSGSTSKPAGLANILNDSPVDDVVSSQMSSQGNEYISDSYFIDVLLDRIVAGSSGCSVDQLEQLNRELMNGLWALRGEWNRNVVAAKLADIFNETIKDIDSMQTVLKASQPTQHGNE